MATVKHAISEHRVVALRGEPVGTWPAGTTGAVISSYGDTVLVEVTHAKGKTLDTIQVPRAGLGIRQSWSTELLGRQRPPDRRDGDHCSAPAH